MMPETAKTIVRGRRVSMAARAGISQGVDDQHGTGAATRSFRPEAFGTGEGDRKGQDHETQASTASSSCRKRLCNRRERCSAVRI